MNQTGEYSYYIVPALEALRKGGLTEEEANRCRRLIAANVGDEMALRRILGVDPEEYARFYPDMTVVTPTTSDTIDAFLQKFGEPAMAKIVEKPVGKSEEKPAEAGENVSELIKKRDYQGALEIIRRLSLNNPEKSVYFADQIRFLKKLILNQRRVNKQV